jgi:hypothetical protein
MVYSSARNSIASLYKGKIPNPKKSTVNSNLDDLTNVCDEDMAIFAF